MANPLDRLRHHVSGAIARGEGTAIEERAPGWYTIRYDALATFKQSWPCHGLPDALHSISFEYASNGDLVDIEAYDENQKRLDSSEFDGPALLALSQDALKIGDKSE